MKVHTIHHKCQHNATRNRLVTNLNKKSTNLDKRYRMFDLTLPPHFSCLRLRLLPFDDCVVVAIMNEPTYGDISLCTSFVEYYCTTKF